jgi:hypothetical protein
LPPAYLYQKDERALLGNIHSSKISVFSMIINATENSDYFSYSIIWLRDKKSDKRLRVLDP